MEKLKLNLFKLRKNAGLTQSELGNKLNVSFQTVSKWENGNSMPDIGLLPEIARIFKVSIDQLLGVIPIEYSSYNKRLKDSSTYRNKILDQFTASRQLYWNDDYLEFIIKKVWKITLPIHVAELNCGNGIFATQILKHLPFGSTYTGYEKSENMRESGVTLFKDSTYVHIDTFENAKIIKDKFDLVICQGYLRHLNNPLDGIAHMIRMTKLGGLIVGHEENRPFEISGLLLGDLKDDSFEKGLFLDKLWNNELSAEGRDYRIGLRLPLLLKQSGLSNIQSRLNDHLDILLGDNDAEETLALLNAHYKLTSINEDTFLSFLMERGLTRYEAQRYIEMYHNRKNYMNKKHSEINIVHCMGLVLSWGRKIYSNS